MKFKHLLSWLVVFAAPILVLAACASARPATEDPAIAAIYAEADAKAAQARAQQLREEAREASNATATAAFAPFAAQTREAQAKIDMQARQTAEAAPAATATIAMQQTATAAPLATAAASQAQTATAAPIATEQARQVMAAQTVAVAPTATWVAFQLEEAKRAAQQQTEQQNAFVSRLLDLAWISGLVILVVAGAIILGRQIAKNFSQTAQARATAATQVEQARAATERERQKAEKAKAFAAQAKPPIYIIEEKNATTASPFGSASTPSTPVMQSIHQHSITPHGDQDIQTIWEAPLLVEPEGSLEQTDTLVIDNSHQGRT